jgi:hypothetical protein
MADEPQTPDAVGDADDGSGAIRAMAMLMTAIESGCYVEYFDEPRDDGVTNTQIVEWHKQGVRRKDRVVIRDITPTADDERKAAEAFEKAFQHQLDLAAKRKSATTAKGKRKGFAKAVKDVNLAGKTDENQAAVSSAMRAAAKELADAYWQKWNSRTGADGAQLEAVTEEYAEQRQRKYMISADVILQRTGQLARGIAKGRYKISFDKGAVKKIAESVKATGDAGNS